MYQFSYAEVLADNPVDARETERLALDRAIMLLQAAEASSSGSREEQDALTFINQLWGLLIKDLAHPANDLPAEMRAGLMSIGLWIMGEAQRIQVGQSRNFAAIADICGLIRDGMA